MQKSRQYLPIYQKRTVKRVNDFPFHDNNSLKMFLFASQITAYLKHTSLLLI